LTLAKPFRFYSIRGKPLLTILKYPGNFLLNYFLLHILLCPALAKTQACTSGELLGERPSQDLGNFKKDFCGIYGAAKIRKYQITLPRKLVLVQFPIAVCAFPPPPEAFCSTIPSIPQTWIFAVSKLLIVQIRFK